MAAIGEIRQRVMGQGEAEAGKAFAVVAGEHVHLPLSQDKLLGVVVITREPR